MSIVVDRVKWPAAGLWPALLFGALPGLMVFWDWSTGADLVGRLWTIPMPVLALIAVATTGLMAMGAASGKALSNCGQTGIWTGRAAGAIFVYAILVTALAAANPVFGLLKLTELALCAMLALALAARFRVAPQERHRALCALVIGTVLSLPLLAALRLSGLLDHLAPLMVPGYVHIRIMGFTLALTLAGAFGLYSASNARFRLALFLAMTLLWSALFWTGGRGAPLAILAGTLVSAAVLPALRKPLFPLIASALMGYCIILLPGVGGFGIATRMEAVATAASADELSSGRLEMWRTLLAESLANPVIGHGYAQARDVFLDAGFATAHLHAHNILLDAVLALGLPLGGLAGVTALLAASLGTLNARRAADPVSAAGAAIVWVFLAHALVDGIHFYAQGLLPLTLGAALLMSARR